MQWKTVIKQTQQLYSWRTISKFAFLPTKLTDGHTVWFEFYHSNQQYTYVGTREKWITAQTKIINTHQL